MNPPLLKNSRPWVAVILIFCGCIGHAASTVSLHDDGTSVRIPLTVFGKETHFMVDTAADITLVDLRFEKMLGPPTATNSLMTLSATRDILTYRGPNLTIGKETFACGLVAHLDLTTLRMIAGEHFDGVLGMNVMMTNVIVFDPDAATFSIGGKVPTQLKRHATRLPLVRDQSNGFKVKVQANGKPLELTLDTGSNFFLNLNLTDWDRVFAGRNEPIHENAMVGGDGIVINTKYARIGEVRIGTNIFRNVIVGQTPNRKGRSTLGFDFVRRHITAMDFPNRSVYLVPGKQFSAPQPMDLSGLRLIKTDAGVVVHSLRTNSPAAAAGFRPGDTINVINGIDASTLRLKTIREMLRTKAGELIEIKLRRNNEARELSFHLKEIF